MDANGFDRVAKALTAAGSRRAVAKGLAGGMGVGALALLGAGRTQARRRRGIRGALTTDDATFTRCGGGGPQTTFFYDDYTFRHDGGPFSALLARRGVERPLEDPFLFLYSSFDPNAPCANIVAQSDDGGCGNDSYITLPDLPAGRYTLVATSFDDEVTGQYRLIRNISQPCAAVAATDQPRNK